MTWLQPDLRTAACSFAPKTAPEQSALPAAAVLVTPALPTVNRAGKSWLIESADGSPARVATCCHGPRLGVGGLTGETAAAVCEPGARPGAPPPGCWSAMAATTAMAGTQTPATTTRRRVRTFRLAVLRARAVAARVRPADLAVLPALLT